MKLLILFLSILISLASASKYSKLLVTANLRNASSFVLDLQKQIVCADFPDFPIRDVAGGIRWITKAKVSICL